MQSACERRKPPECGRKEGQANAGISKGSPVMTPYYLNEFSYLPHIGKNYYQGFIDNAINSYDKWAVDSYQKIFMKN